MSSLTHQWRSGRRGDSGANCPVRRGVGGRTVGGCFIILKGDGFCKRNVSDIWDFRGKGLNYKFGKIKQTVVVHCLLPVEN